MSSENNLAPLISTLGENLVGCELGVLQGTNTVALVDRCSNIKTLYGIDFYQPYKDVLFNYEVCDKGAEHNKQTTLSKIQKCSRPDAIKLVVKSFEEAIKDFPDEFFDFVYVDTAINDNIYYDTLNWYPKVKPGGLYAGHDWYHPRVKELTLKALTDAGYAGELRVVNNESWYIIK